MSYNSKYTGEQVEGFLDQIANGEISEGSSVYKWNWNSEMNGTFTEEEFENLSNADVVYITTGVAGMEMLYSVDGRVVVEDALHLGIHILSFETDTDNSEAAYVESITFIFDNASKTWSAQGGNSELITNEQLTSALEDKQDKITDLDAIRSGAEKGATALQSVPSEYVTESELTNKGYATTSALNDKVDKVSGKQLSTEDFTTALKTKLEGLSNYDDTELSEALSTLRGDFDALVSGDTTTAIKTFNEVIAFLDGIQDSQDLSSIIASIEQQIAGKMDKVTLATVATSGSYNDLSNKPTIPAEQVNADWNATSGKAQILNKPTIPSAVTESTVSGWGFTKNTGTLTGVAINGTTINASNGVVYIPNASMGSYGTTKLNSSTNSTSTSEAATPSAVKAAYDLANGKQDQLVSGTSIKTINNQSLLGSGNITISGGGAVPTKLSQLENDTNFVALQGEELPYVETAGLYDPISSVLYSLPGGEWTGAEDKKLAGVVNVGGFNLVECQGITGSSGDMIVLPREADGYEDDILVTRSYLKTINGESILGSGDIEISGGSGGGSGAYPEVDGSAFAGNVEGEYVCFSLEPNKFYVFPECKSLSIAFASPISGVANEYLFQFTSGVMATTLNLFDDTIKWANDSPPTIEPNMIYQVSILKGLASVLEFKGELIRFYIYKGNLEQHYYGEENMTWKDWANSSYNTDGYSILGSLIVDNTGIYNIASTMSTDTIIPNYFYTLELGGGGPA